MNWTCQSINEESLVSCSYVTKKRNLVVKISLDICDIFLCFFGKNNIEPKNKTKIFKSNKMFSEKKTC